MQDRYRFPLPVINRPQGLCCSLNIDQMPKHEKSASHEIMQRMFAGYSRQPDPVMGCCQV